MTKHDILNMKDSKEIMKTLKTHYYLWDAEVNEHLKKVSKQRLIELYGTDDIIVKPGKKKK